MSDLSTILNPDNGRKRTVKLLLNSRQDAPTSELTSPAQFPSTSQLSSTTQTPTSSEISSAVYEISSIELNDNVSSTDNTNDHEDPPCYDHEVHPDCPDTLACLPDTEGRPQHTLPVILRCAILGSPRKRLTIREIYAAMEAKYPYYKTAGPTWKQSVRHHLSLNRLFERQPRPVTDPGFGSYWTVNLSAPPGTKRPRKRGRANKDALPQGDPGPAKKRGRPRKASVSTITREATPPISSHEEDYEDDKFTVEEDTTGMGSEDDYESEEELIPPYDRRSSLVGLTAYIPRPPQPFTLPPFSSLDNNSELMERMQLEISSLRRQSAEAVSVSLRLSEQLSQAHADAARSRAELREVKDMLEHEVRARRDAQRMAEEESDRRRAAESALSDMLASTSHSRPP
ncbi:hypothetical protein BDQ12DRAFT_624518 [Crucibulum laeve]|uniref:Fork-head domain-containing protein n=1 Tax=Crucibulum laeve TaxID=68775 RepID=A0A5C3M941_9AGAR|nr:hypothetical protein BDQ12DRAFT_624518 [Crucibulum laeve]